MTITNYFINIQMQLSVAVRFYLNDMPVWRFLRQGPDSMNGGANEWLVPGENVLTMEIVESALTLPNKPADHPMIQVAIFKAKEGGATHEDVEVIHQVRFPDLWDEVSEELKVFPYRHESRFVLPASEVYRPRYLDAPEQDIPSDGTPELHQVVQDLYAAIQSGDGSRFADLLTLQFEEYERANGGAPHTDIASQRTVVDNFFAHPIVVKDLEMDRLVFESRANGRLVHVIRDDGQPVFQAVATDDPTEHLEANALLTFSDGQWRAV